MDAKRIGRLHADLWQYLTWLDGCFARSEGREPLRRYVGGQVSSLPRMSVEAMADAADVVPRTFQDQPPVPRPHAVHAVHAMHAAEAGD